MPGLYSDGPVQFVVTIQSVQAALQKAADATEAVKIRGEVVDEYTRQTAI